MPLCLATTEDPGLALDPVAWVGPALPGGATALRWTPPDAEAARAVIDGDPVVLSALVAREAMPVALLHALAERAFDRHPGEARLLATRRRPADPRWAHALARVAATRPAPPPSPDADPAVHTRLPEGRAWGRAVALGEGVALVEAVGPLLHRVGRRGPPRAVRLPVADDARLELVAAGGDSEQVLVVERSGEGELRAWRVGEEDDLGVVLHGRLPGELRRWWPAGEGVRLHGEHGVCWLMPGEPGPTVPRAWPYPPAPLDRGDGRLLLATAGPDGRPHLTWRAVDDGRELAAAAAWPGRTIAALAPAPDGAWVGGEAGLARLSFDGRLEPVSSEAVLGLVSTPGGVVVLGVRGWGPPMGPRLPLPGGATMDRGEALGERLLLLGSLHWVVVDRQGQVVARAMDEGVVSRVDGPLDPDGLDGTVVVMCGNDLCSLDGATGEVRARVRTPWDGSVTGATARAVVVGAPWSGNPRTPGEGWLAFDADLGLVGRYPIAHPARAVPDRAEGGWSPARGLCTADAVWALDGRDLLRWRPSSLDAAAALPAEDPPQLRRGEVQVRWHTYNPREDWGVQGIGEVDCDVLAEGGRYGGTTGVCPACAVLGPAGRVLVLDRCVLANAADVNVGAASTVILVRCRLDPSGTVGPWVVHADGQLVLLDATGLSGACISLVEQARLWIDGALVAVGPATWRLD